MRTPFRHPALRLSLIAGLAAAVLAGCSSADDDATPPPTTIAGGHSSAVGTPTPLSPGWTENNLTEPVLEPDAANVPFTQVPDNPKGVLLPPNTKIDGPVMWQAVGCQALPFSTDAGPTRRTKTGWPAGWTQDEKGAALAAWSMAILFEVVPSRDDFTAGYLDPTTAAGFVDTSEVRDPRAGVRAENWRNAAQCFRESPIRRVDLEFGVTLSDNNTRAAVRFRSPKYNATWDFPLVWDAEEHDWKATKDGFRQYWKTVDDPTDRPISPDFTW
ncbi:hypothetical protein FOV72_19730 [Gordonia rubripertincta]|uniref:hypothetical protein n=1 Tax=Gordonia rubripertincta TaxID=36822 RepID=UPI00117D092D|nr:hypothetical protein [Gordonia rubripertincta]TSD93493.1 hypothetical protein FOV72_19730 [Gordonia rubripertincta]